MAFCEAKVRLLQAYNEAVDNYCALAQRRHDAFGGLDGATAAALMAQIEAVSQEAKQRMRAANEHMCGHKCGSVIYPHSL